MILLRHANIAAGQQAFDWFYFDEIGNMVTGWFCDADGNRYYLNPIPDGTQGRMCTGWQQIDGKWYYFNPISDGYRGKLLTNTITPDGYWVDKNGVWDGKTK
ncbi:MAG: hypothetical protein Q4F29_04070 [Lachnospiraceae bacterium]|nr:hypothetical protein [Lachnospiraceae bacterium]